MNYGSIRTHFKALLNRSDITDALADTFIAQGITRIQRSLRIPSMEVKNTYNFSSQTAEVTLPSDFLEAIDIYFGSGDLTRLPMREMQEMSQGNEVGSPRYFSREGSRFILYPQPSSGSLILNYYASFEELTTDSSVNSLSNIGSDLIIYAALTYASDYYIDERSPVFDSKYMTFMSEIQEQANDQEMTGSIQSIRPSYRI
tara:strand:- start:4722 stop:5324 length:603 start_codon:yes stop_codon:yes gene_type:complete